MATQKPPTTPASSNGASVKLNGSVGSDFNIVKEHIEKTIAGITTRKADVLSHALHLAAAGITAKEQPEKKVS